MRADGEGTRGDRCATVLTESSCAEKNSAIDESDFTRRYAYPAVADGCRNCDLLRVLRGIGAGCQSCRRRRSEVHVEYGMQFNAVRSHACLSMDLIKKAN